MTTPAASTLTVAFLEAHPRDAARVLERLDATELGPFADTLAAPACATLLAALTPAAASRCIAAMTTASAIAAIQSIDPVTLAPVLRRIPEAIRAPLIAGLPNRARRALKTVMAYPETLVGAATDPHALTLPDDIEIAEAVRLVKDGRDRLKALVAVLDAENRLVGMVDVRDLLAGSQFRPIRAITRDAPGVLSARAKLTGTLDHFAWHQASVLPVVDPSQVFVGVLDHEAALRSVERMRAGGPIDMADTLLALADLFWGTSSGIIVGLTGGTDDEHH